jgi:hypothetical protein
MESGARGRAWSSRGAAVRLLVLAVVAAAVLGCSAASSGPAAPSGPKASPVLPRQMTGAERALLDEAEQILTRECMARYGFQMSGQPGGRPTETPSQLPEFPYVVDDVPWARQHGYGSDLREQAQKHVQEAQAADPDARYFAALPSDRQAAAVAALNGARPDGLEARLPDGSLVRHSDQGCSSEAARRLYADLPGWFRASRTLNDIPSAAFDRMVRDPRLRRAVGQWASCMRGAGLAYPSPEALHAALGPHPPRDREVRFAVAEATCATRTPLARTARQLHQHYLRQLNDEYRAQVATLRRLQLAALPRAAAITHHAQP